MARRPTDLLLAAVLLAGCGHDDSIAVPTADEAITIDGKQIEPAWDDRAVREQLMTGNDLARPYSEVRFLRDDRDLLVGLYAADEDVRSTDGFDLRIGSMKFRVDVRGRLTPAPDGVRAAVDIDEDTTVDQPDDFDEEWVVELAVPLDAIGGLRARTPVEVARCDTPKDGIERCGSWSGELVP